MALVLADRVKETTTTTGTGTITLAGASAGFQSFAAIGNGNTTYYTISGGTEWEVGIGTYTSAGTTLSRDTVLASSAGGTTKVNFSAGTKDVFVTYPAGKSVNYDAANNVGIGNTTPGAKLDVTGNIRLSAANPNIELNNGGAMVYSPAGNTLAFAKGGGPSSPVETMRIDSNSVVGINVVPSAWQSGRSVLQVGPAAMDTSNSAQVVLSANRYFDGTNDKYIATAFATAYQQLNGAHIWYRASSGTAGANMTLNESARFDTSGNFLLGTSTTKNRLTVTAGANVNSPTLGSAGGIAYFTNPDVSYGLNIGNSAADGRVWLQAQRTDGSATAYNITLNEAGGNVGIGQASPNTKLWVGSAGNGSGVAAPDAISIGDTFANSAGDAAKAKFRVFQNAGGAIYGLGVSANLLETHVPSGAAMAWYTGNTERMRLTSDGVFGLGLSGGDASFHLVGIRGGNGRMTQMSTGGTSQTNLNLIASSNSGGGDQWFSYGVSSSNYYYVQQGVGAGSSGLVVNSSNRVIVGTATAFDATVGANFMAFGSAGSAAAFKVDAASSTQVSFYDNTQAARVGWIGTGGSTTSYNTTSDRRLKRDIQPVGDVGDKLDAIQIISHKWRNGTDVTIPYGVIAQDLYEVAPHAVTKGDDGEEVGIEWGVDYSKLVPMLVKEIQSLRARVAQLEGK